MCEGKVSIRKYEDTMANRECSLIYQKRDHPSSKADLAQKPVIRMKDAPLQQDGRDR